MRLRAGTTIVFALVVACGIFFRAYGVERKTFWEDEALGAMHMLGYTEAEIVEASPQIRDARSMQRYFALPPRDSLLATVHSLQLEDPQHPPIYYLLTHAWVRVFGPSVNSIRSLAVLFGILVLPCAFWFGYELFPEGGVPAVFTMLVALSPIQLLYSQEAREYSLWSVATLLLCIAFLRARASGGVARWTLYALALALNLYIFPISALVALGFGLYLAFYERPARAGVFAGYGIATLAAALSFAPWLASMLTSAGLRLGMGGIATAKLTLGSVVFIFARDLRSAFFDFGTFRAGPIGSSVLNASSLVAAVALVAYATVVLVRNAPRERSGFLLVALCAPFALLVAADLSGHGRFVYQARYFMPLLLAVQLAVAYALARGFARTAALGRVVLALVLLGEAASCFAISRADTWWNKDYERSPHVAAVINEVANPVVVSDDVTPSILALSRYLLPDVTLRLALRCAMCSVAPAARMPDDASAANVFVLGAPEDAANHGARWIDPRPYPPQSNALSMFEAR